MLQLERECPISLANISMMHALKFNSCPLALSGSLSEEWPKAVAVRSEELPENSHIETYPCESDSESLASDSDLG